MPFFANVGHYFGTYLVSHKGLLQYNFSLFQPMTINDFQNIINESKGESEPAFYSHSRNIETL